MVHMWAVDEQVSKARRGHELPDEQLQQDSIETHLSLGIIL